MARAAKPSLHDQRDSIKFMEQFLSVAPKHSFFNGKQDQFNKMLIFSAARQYSKRDDFPSKIFRRNNIMYVCISYDEYHAMDLITNRKVGHVLIQDDWLTDIEVDTNYRRQGIGTNLIRAVVKTIGNDFHIPVEGCRRLNSYYLTDEGAALVNSCIKKGIINDEQCMLEPPRTPPRSP